MTEREEREGEQKKQTGKERRDKEQRKIERKVRDTGERISRVVNIEVRQKLQLV